VNQIKRKILNQVSEILQLGLLFLYPFMHDHERAYLHSMLSV